MFAQNIKYLLRFTKYFKPYLVKMIVVYFLSLLNTGINILQPLLYMVIIDTIASKRGVSILIYLILIYTFISLFQRVISYIEDFLSMYSKNFILLDIKSELFNHIQRLPLSYFSKETPAKLINRITNDVNAFAIFIDGTLKNTINNIFSVIGIVVVTRFMGMEYIVIALISTSFSYLASILFSRHQKSIEKEQSESRGDIYNSISETLSAIDLVKISITQSIETKKFYNLSLRQIFLSIKAQNLSYLKNTYGEIIDISTLAAVFIYGGLNVINGIMSIGGLLAIYQYINQLKRSLNAFALQYVGVKLAFGIIERVLDVFRTEPEETHTGNKFVIQCPTRGLIQFANVSYGYPDKKFVLRNANFILNHGDTVLLLGPSGIGKTTIIKLLLRYLVPGEGKILVDEQDIQEANLDSYRSQFGVVLQELRLFSGSIRENICYGVSEISEDDMINAAKISQIHYDIMKLKNAYDTIISANQTELSVGQKQRLALARAIVRNPSILVLDEATGALDINTDKLIMTSLEEVFNNRTCIIISHKYIPLNIFNRVFLVTGEQVTEITKEEYANIFGH